MCGFPHGPHPIDKGTWPPAPGPRSPLPSKVLRERFSAVIRKPVYTLQFDRYATVHPALVPRGEPPPPWEPPRIPPQS